MTHLPMRLVAGVRSTAPLTDVVVVGSGIAGLTAALRLSGAGLGVTLVTKTVASSGSTRWAQGGIAAALAPTDSADAHYVDTMGAGGGLCDPAAVRVLVDEGPRLVRGLVRLGARFDLDPAGEIALTREGGHGADRIAHAGGDATGEEISRALVAALEGVTADERVQLIEHTFAVDVLTDAAGAACGVLVAGPGGTQELPARAVVLASGGIGQVYRSTTNPPEATGDGVAAALRAGAVLADLEFVQFHPTVLWLGGGARGQQPLISEALRGEGAWLLDEGGHRFMPDVDPRGELAPRDVVARAIFKTMETTQNPNVYLDLSHLPAELVTTRFPGISRTCRAFGLDITTDRVPVRPGAHYMIGGVTVDTQGRTSLPNLWEAGEVTSSGLHGANRLASNSLLEGLVYGAICGRNASAAALATPDSLRVPAERFAMLTQEPGGYFDPTDVANSLKSLMVRKMGIVRDRKRLGEAAGQVEFWCRYALRKEFDNRPGWELQNLLTVARLMIAGATAREESRGTHFRSDFPARAGEAFARQLPSPSRVAFESAAA